MLTGIRIKYWLILAVIVVAVIQIGPKVTTYVGVHDEEVISLDASWSPGIRPASNPVVHTWTVEGKPFPPVKTVKSPWREHIRVRRGAQVVLTSKQSTAGHLVNSISYPGKAGVQGAGQTHSVNEPAIASRY